MQTSENSPKPPSHLSKPAKKWWKAVVEDYDLDAHHIHLLRLAAEALDRGTQAREIIDRDGMTFTDRFGCPRARPEVAVERDSRIAFARLVRELAIDAPAPDAPRPPRTADYAGRR
ncbi:hypothetical protein [Mesorhizobium sp. CA7]|uniref:hypothetical protein n=1 Tax=Mesorhizobium sp. CA7 TaxID=588501 RepID=UPI001CCC5417|nr:hypothetical protein [Mesorhizobium sp. CA7]MBZ9815050.1 hypothetical protein [Mesorhizobium sp. CA7]